MDTIYADDALLKAVRHLDSEGSLIKYLAEVGSGERWIYTESAHICRACEIAAHLLIAKNQELTLLLAERDKWEALADKAAKKAYTNGRRSMAQELRHAMARGSGLPGGIIDE